MDAQEAEIGAHFIGQTVGLFRGYVGADNCSAVNLTTEQIGTPIKQLLVDQK